MAGKSCGLCRYITRPAIANERLKRDGSGDVVLQLKSAWRDGTTHIKMSPLEFMQRLAALVPRPRLHLIRFHGVLAPNAGLRATIVPRTPQKPGADAAHHAHEAPARMGWARLLKRVFDLDLEHCPQCGGTLKIIAAIEEPAVIVRILTHLGLRCPRTTALTGAAADSLPGGLILEARTVLQRGLTIRPGPRSREAVRLPRREAIRVDLGPEESTREGNFQQNTVRLTACRAGDRVVDSEKRGLNFLFALFAISAFTLTISEM